MEKENNKKSKKNRSKVIKNKKGFTLVELLVSMSILGLLMVMAFPTMRAVQTNNTNSKFEQYGKAILAAAKLYVESYSEDMFKKSEENAKSVINYSDLKDKGLIRETEINEANCNSTSVTVVKFGDEYTYCLDMACYKGSREVYTKHDTSGKCVVVNNLKIKYKYKDQLHEESITKGATNYSVKSPSTLFSSYSTSDKFDKWKGSDGKDYKPGDKIAGPINDNITLSADLGEDPNTCKGKINITITYHLNKSGTVFSDTQTESKKVTVTDTQYTFLGASSATAQYEHIKSWNLKKNGGGTNFVAGEKISTSSICTSSTNCTCNIDVYAQWDVNQCTIKYDANQGYSYEASGVTYKPCTKAKFNKNTNSVEQVVDYNQIWGDNATPIRDPRSSFFDAKCTDYIPAVGAEWNEKPNGKGNGYSIDGTYDIKQVCKNLDKGNQTVTMYVKWLSQKPDFRIYYWKHTDNDCNKSGSTAIKKHPYRQYHFYPFACICKYKANGDFNTVETHYRKHSIKDICSPESFQYWDGASKARKKRCFSEYTYIYYHKTGDYASDGMKSCKNSNTDTHPINYYVYQACTEGDTKNHKSDAKWFHGAFFYWTKANNNVPKYTALVSKWLVSVKSARTKTNQFTYKDNNSNIKSHAQARDKAKSESFHNLCENYCKQIFGKKRYADGSIIGREVGKIADEYEENDKEEENGDIDEYDLGEDVDEDLDD